jgi:tRNA (guanine6-N2)-methyltransferase
MTTYHLTTLPGLAPLLGEYVRQHLSREAQVGATLSMRHNDLVPVSGPVESAALLQVRLAEDVFIQLGRVPLTGRPVDMKALASHKLWQSPLKEALAEWSQLTGKPLTKRLTWRVVVQADDVAWRQYRRLEIMLATEAALLRTGTSWRLNRDEAPLELWLQQVGHELVVSLRLSTNQDRQHGGRTVERAAALRPSVAAAMVWLSRPTDDDVVLDPMCGSGTLLLERAMTGRYRQLLGGDNDPQAVTAALANFGPRHQPRRIERWDATQLPLADASVTTVLCNLPWGRQIGEQAAMPRLYQGVLAEATRVLGSGGRMVLLTSEWAALKAALRNQPELRLERTVSNVNILGRRADIFMITRADRP